MQKYTFTVEIVSEGLDQVDVVDVRQRLSKAVRGVHGRTYDAVNIDDITDLGTQGLKVWAKRRMGVSLANPKPPKKKKVKVEAVETVEEASQPVEA